MSDLVAIVLFGSCCSGKSSLAATFEPFGWPSIEVSSVARTPEGVQLSDIPWPTLAKTVDDIHHNVGRDYFGRQLRASVAPLDKRGVVVCGPRTIEEVRSLHQVRRVITIGLLASLDVRLERLLRRRPGSIVDDCRTYLREREAAEERWGMADLFAYTAQERVFNSDELSAEELGGRVLKSVQISCPELFL